MPKAVYGRDSASSFYEESKQYRKCLSKHLNARFRLYLMFSDKLICIMRFLQKLVIGKTNTPKQPDAALQSTKAGPSVFVADRSTRTQFEQYQHLILMTQEIL